MKYRSASCYDVLDVNFDNHAPSTKNVYIEEIFSWREDKPVVRPDVASLRNYINRNLWVNGIGLILSVIALIIAAFLRNWYAIAIALTLSYGFMEMLITVIVDKRTSLK